MKFEHSSTKRAVLEKLLEQSMVLVTLDARTDGVSVPEHLVGDPQLRLNLSYRFDLPMELDDAGIRATLTFGGMPHDCEIPWHSIYMFVSHATGQPFLFPSDIPPEAAAAFGDVEIGERPGPQRADGAPTFRVVAGEASGDDEPGPDATDPNDGGSPKRAHLRVIK